MSTSRKTAWGTVVLGTPRTITEMRGDNWAIVVNPISGTVKVEVCWGPDLTTPDWRDATNQAAAAMTAIAVGDGATARTAVFIAPAPLGLRITTTGVGSSCEYEIIGRPFMY
jgi:hypothetical protein